MSDYPATPQHDKITDAEHQFIQRAQMLFEDLENKGYVLHYLRTSEHIWTNQSAHLRVILEFLGVDYVAWLEEKDAILAHIRDQYEEKGT